MNRSRRDDVLAEMCRVGRGVSALRVAWALGLTTTTVRRHLNDMLAEGLVERRSQGGQRPVVWTVCDE